MLDARKPSAVAPLKMVTTTVFFIINEPVKPLLDCGPRDNLNIHLTSQFLTLQFDLFRSK